MKLCHGDYRIVHLLHTLYQIIRYCYMSHKQLSLNLKIMAESMDTETVNLIKFKFKLIINN
jgi:hypothetical protein